MAHQVEWTKRVTDLFVSAAQLTDLQRQVLQTRIAGMPIKRQARYFSVSVRTINRIVDRLKRKYDTVQLQYPNDLPARKKSAQEDYLDNN